MQNNNEKDAKKIAKLKARNAKKLLISEQRNNSAEKRQKKKQESENNTSQKKLENELWKKTQHEKKLLLQEEKNKRKRKEIVNLKNREKLEKFDKKINHKKIKNEIKEINKANKKPKGKINIPNSTKDTIIDVKNVTKSYTTKSLIFNAIDGVSLSIKRGEFVAILGPSGSGKSTLLNLISGLDRPTNGEIIIDGTNIAALNERGLTSLRRDKVGFVFQSYNLLPTLNVSDNVEIGRSLQTDKKKRMSIDKVLTDMNMNEQKTKRTHELSGGQQQRVSIARAIAKAPEILIGDEPTGALDTKSKADVFELFQKVNKENKTTIIVVTHNKDIAKLADKVIKVKDGKIEKITINKKPLKAKELLKLED